MDNPNDTKPTATVYMVFGTSGDYDECTEWPVRAFTDERAAEEFAVGATRRVLELAALKRRWRAQAFGRTTPPRDIWSDAYAAWRADNPNEYDPDAYDAETTYYIEAAPLDVGRTDTPTPDADRLAALDGLYARAERDGCARCGRALTADDEGAYPIFQEVDGEPVCTFCVALPPDGVGHSLMRVFWPGATRATARDDDAPDPGFIKVHADGWHAAPPRLRALLGELGRVTEDRRRALLDRYLHEHERERER